MQSPRDLLLTLLNALLTLLRLRPGARPPRPAHGPAHPWRLAHLRAAPPRAPAAPPPAPPLARPARPPLPPHLAALLASAPDVEPEFQRAPPPLVRLAEAARGLVIHRRLCHDRVPRTAPAVRRTPAPAPRIASALDAIGRWLVRASPARRVRDGAV